MAKSNPQSLSEAIHRLENAAEKAGQGSALGADLDSLKQALEDLKPHFRKIKSDVTAAATETFEKTTQQVRESIEKGQDSVKEISQSVDRQVRENPWVAMGLVGLVAFLIGYLLGRKD